MKNIYFLSGLGADRRVFEYLKLEGFDLNHIEWVRPMEPESIQSYAARLCAQIKTPRPILIGVSFGGMMAIEIAKLIDVEKVVVISSAKSTVNIPRLNKLGKTKIHRLIPASFLKFPNEVMYWFFGVSNKKDKRILRNIIIDSDERFVAWALDKLLTWSNTIVSENVISIHGSRDRLIPLTTADFVIPDGGHLMIMSHHQEVSAVINKILNNQ